MRLLAGLVALLLISGCSSEKEQLPPVSDCTSGCSNSGTTEGGSGSGGAAGAGGASGSAGAAGSGGAVDPNGAKVEGTVVVHSEQTFSQPKLYTLSALVSAAAADVSSPPADSWTGSGAFSLARVAVGDSWLKATPTALSDTTLGGLVQLTVASGSSTGAEVPVVDTGVIAAILGTLPSAPAVAQDASHAVLTFVDSTDAPLAGVKVTPSFTATTVYDSGPQFAEIETGSRGQALLLNVLGATNPKVDYETKAGQKGSATLILQSNVVTFARVVVP